MNNVEDITKFYSVVFWVFIHDILDFAHQNGSSLANITHLVHHLLNSKFIAQYFSDDEVIALKKNLPIKNSDEKGGYVVIDSEIHKLILFSYLISTSQSRVYVQVEDLMLAVLHYPPLSKTLSLSNINVHMIDRKIVQKIGGIYKQSEDNSVNKIFLDLTETTKHNKVETIGRIEEIGSLVRLLSKESNKNVLLVGEKGVGKYSIVEGFIQYTLSPKSIKSLNGIRILKLNPQLLSDTTSQRTNELWSIIEHSDKSTIIFFIENLTDFVTQLDVNAKRIYKNLTLNNQIRILAIDSTVNYNKVLIQETDFISKFEVLKIEEPSIDDSIKIVQKDSKKLAIYHRVNIENEAIVAAVNYSKKYITDSFLPDKAIEIIDEACTLAKDTVVENDILRLIAKKTGIPLEKLSSDEKTSLINLESILNSQVISQENAVHKVAEVVRRSRAGLNDSKRPIGSFLFLGPSGVGKTELAKVLSKTIYNNDKSMIRLDMSEYSESHTVQRLIGSPPGYIGYDEGGQLTNPVLERPYSLILLDEVEKAHPKVFDIFLQVLDEGRLTDNKGRVVDFRNTILIFTSNIGSELYSKRIQPFKDSHSFNLATVLGYSNSYKTLSPSDFVIPKADEFSPYLRKFFRVEFINRFDEIVIFSPLDKSALVKIARLKVNSIQKRLNDRKITINVTDEAINKFVNDAYDPELGARPLNRVFQEKVENVIANKIISGELIEGGLLTI